MGKHLVQALPSVYIYLTGKADNKLDAELTVKACLTLLHHGGII